MTLTYDYDHSYDGPALPVVDLRVYRAGHKRNGVTVSHALVDSGADATMLPLRVLQQVQAQKVDWTRVRGVHGPSYIVEIYEVDLKLSLNTVPSLFVVADKFNRDAVSRLIEIRTLADVVRVGSLAAA